MSESNVARGGVCVPMRAGRWLWLWAALAASGVAAQQPDCPTPAKDPKEATFYGPTKQAADTLIVFVHGGNSNTTDAFTFKGRSGNPDVFWPCLVRQDAAFANADVFLYDYDSSKRSTDAQSAEGEARSMWDELKGTIEGAAQYRKLIFVAHSLGGLITRRMLFNHGNDEPMKGRVPFVLLLGSPTRGINKEDEKLLPTLIKVLSVPGQPQVKDFHTGSDFLDGLGRDWSAYKALPARTTLYCGAEDQTTKTHLAESSTLSQCDRCMRFAGLDHHEIAKPNSLAATPHRALADANARSGSTASPGAPTLFAAACHN